jgi:hypothetical protein
MHTAGTAKRVTPGEPNPFDYLGRYAHAIAISNRRLTALSDCTYMMAWSAGQFAGRFLLFPPGLQRTRHYGVVPQTATACCGTDATYCVHAFLKILIYNKTPKLSQN